MREKLIDALTIISRVRITPRMRGKHTGRKSADAALRITPAHAGKTSVCLYSYWLNADHPRTCGENNRVIFSESYDNGSPPHMRGKRHTFTGMTNDFRITPAHAGKTPPTISDQITTTDHPRTCGENKRPSRC